MRDLVDMLTIHYYLLFNGPDNEWEHARALYNDDSVFSFTGQQFRGTGKIFNKLLEIRKTLAGSWPSEKLVHMVEKVQCRAHGTGGVAIRVSGSIILGNQFIICGDGLLVEELPNFKDLSIDISSKRVGKFTCSSTKLE